MPFFEKGVVPVPWAATTAPCPSAGLRQGKRPCGSDPLDAHYDTIHEYFGKPLQPRHPLLSRGGGGAGGHLKSIQVGIREGLYGPEDPDQLHRSGLQGL